MKEDLPTGMLFTHLYCERGELQQDSLVFRKRLGAYCQSRLLPFSSSLGDYLRNEMGIDLSRRGLGYDLEKFFVHEALHKVLNSVTLVWRYFSNAGNWNPAVEWASFVGRTLKEENLGYTIDDRCGVHYLIDREFEHSRASVIAALQPSRYAGVLAAFEDAHRHFDAVPPDTKACVRSLFESVEILARLIVPGARNLSRHVVEKALLPLAAQRYAGDGTMQKVLEEVFGGFGRWVDGMHNYRHGQGEEEPVAPPVEFAVFALNSGAAYLRWLTLLDRP